MKNSIKAGVISAFLLIPLLLSGQLKSGKVLSSDTFIPIGYVNIGIIGRNVGTVSDANGNFSINLSPEYDNDSIRLSMIGFESMSFLVSKFRSDTTRNILMTPICYVVPDISVSYSKPRIVALGEPVTTDELRSGFSYNDLGSELGIRVSSKKPILLSNLSLNVAVCTYDSVTYRLKIYRKEEDGGYENILMEPIYLSFKKEDIARPVTFDITKHLIVVQGDLLISLELYRDLGEGKLLFRTQYFTGITYHKKTSEGKWAQSPGMIGMYLKGLVVD